MDALPQALETVFAAKLASEGVPESQRSAYRKWLRFYLDFCRKYRHRTRAPASLPLFLEKLAAKGQSEARQQEAAIAVEWYRSLAQAAATASSREREGRQPKTKGGVLRARDPKQEQVAKGSQGASWQDELDALERAIQMRNYSPKTAAVYGMWARKFQAHTKSKVPGALTTEDVKAFLSDLAVRKKVSASAQNQAFNALLFFFRHVLGREFGEVNGVVRAKRRRYIPVVLSRQEIDAVLAGLEPPWDLVVKLLYGCGLRISECLELRVQCLNLDDRVLTIHDGKGQKDRTMPLPESVLPEIEAQLEVLRRLHTRDLEAGYAGVFMPRRLQGGKFKQAAKEFSWQWFFPAARLTKESDTEDYRRYHLHDTQVRKAIRQAVASLQLTKRVTPHTFRHSFASHLLQANYDIVTIQKLMGHSNVQTTMIYTQTVPSVTLKDAKSPLDLPG